MENNLSQQAINLALSGSWEKAILLNKQIIKADPKDTDALNRLARAYAENGNINLAKRTANKVLKIDPYNAIATKSIGKWKKIKRGSSLRSGASRVGVFLEEPGKTKIVTLINTSDKDSIARLDSGDEVLLHTHSHRVNVCTADGKYIGRLPDDISARIKKLSDYGNEYKAYIKSLTEEEVKVFIREAKRSEQLKDIPSFTSEKVDYISFTPPELVRKKGDLDMGEEDEE